MSSNREIEIKERIIGVKSEIDEILAMLPPGSQTANQPRYWDEDWDERWDDNWDERCD